MTFPQVLLVLIVAIPLALTISNRLRADIAALLIALSLGIAQWIGLPMLGPANTPDAARNAITGFGQSVVITLLSLFVITRALDKTRVTRWIANRLLRFGGQSERRLIVLFTSTAAFLSLFMNNLAAGALLLPSAMDAARRSKLNPSKLLIPVAYGTLLGGAATYFTTANIIMSGLLLTSKPPQTALGILDFTPVGGIMALVGIAYMAAFALRLLPDRPPQIPDLARPTGSDLEAAYQLDERLWEARVPPASALIGQTLAQANIGHDLGIAVIALWHGRQAMLSLNPDYTIVANDILLIAGREERVMQLTTRGLQIGRENTESGSISARGVSMIEVLPAPHSQVLDKTLKALEFRKLYGLTAVALWRDGRSYRTDVADFKLRLGDSFLMVGTRDNKLRLLKSDPDFIVLEPDTSDQPIERKQLALAVGITLGAIALSVIGVPTFLAMLGGAVLIVLSGLLTMDEMYRAVEWQAIFLVAGMYSISLAMTQTGLAALVGHVITSLVSSPIGLAAACYWMTALLTQVMGGQVTALVTGPIAISAALTMDAGSQLPQAIALVTAIACSASFLTPIAHPVNVLMMGPGNYKFADFPRIGMGLTLVCFVTVMLVLPIFWRL